ncbi:sigma-70 family RNA polymerase sigma factor [Sphingosinicella sp. LHD-64]|uniref:sigma-70 family RNA polymerase sigma factor n=1 Tax=Sphingosinicella sp. LHD-64 TaxID=3072139 RepID=UPI00280F6B0D|nr:sigma-70 family RNA polymerase sigma factor [Sphingosinicella sp. LHD-64]MDQ8757543.1 sigma-70 family RNA polymerase sigma factor [Sphingosinicella sp. LHD-64]
MASSDRLDVEPHIAGLLRYARSLTRDPVAADDLVQEALLRAFERAESYDRSRPLRTWLFAILHNEFINAGRQRKAEERRDSALASARVDEVDADQELSAYLAQIARRFDGLPEPQRAVLHLVAVEGLGYRETAEALDIAIGTVMSRLSRARAALREAERPVAANLHVVGSEE